MFKHDLLPRLSIKRIEIEGVRHYETPSGTYPSVTTLLKHYFKKDLSKWIARVGEVEASRITNSAGSRGSALHNMCERFLMNEENIFRGAMPSTIADFKAIESVLKENVNTIYGIEYYLYSRMLKTAGASDLLCEWNGVPTVVDFKTSRREKKEEWIEDYFVQSTIYGMMANEMFDMGVKQIVIMLLVQHERPQIYIKPLTEFMEKVNEVCISNRPNIEYCV